MIDPLLIDELIGPFLREDIGFVDLTSTIMIDADTTAAFDVNAREDIVVAGLDVAAAIFRRCAPGCEIDARVADGDHVQSGAVLARVSGMARGILTAERTALNILQHLSGIATLTAQYVKAIEGTGAQLVDTRKTTPGLRALEKHAVTCGGGRNHRLALDSGVLIKDNHIAVVGGLTAAIHRAKAQVPTLILQPLVENAIKHGISRKEEGGDIKIGARLFNGKSNHQYIELSVEDNGLGKAINQNGKRSRRGVGIANVRERLFQLYEEDFEFKTANANEGANGFRAVMSFPFNK